MGPMRSNHTACNKPRRRNTTTYRDGETRVDRALRNNKETTGNKCLQSVTK